ncbi:MAG: hypothetical protein LBO62_02995, partial [Endomicrobium sp.]|nr:hypothetical protein [Endomicrobium sp.]
ESSKSGKIPAAKYYARLIDARNKNAAQSLGKYGAAMPFDINDYPNICLFLYADKMRRNINGNKVEKELEKLIAGLKDSLSYGEYKAFLERVDDFQNVSQIAAELDRMPEEFKGKYFTPEITKFLDMSVKFRQINPIELVSEERMLVEDIRAALSLNKTELEISFLSDFFLYFEDYLKASISAADYEYLQKKFDKFITLWDKYAFYNQMKGLEADFKLLKDYYEANDKRNEIFLSAFSQNADIENKNFSKRVFNAPVSKIIEGKKDIIVVVTGGYHTKGLADLLNAKGVSYAVVTPSVSGKIEDALKNYENAAAEQAAIFSQSLQLSLFSQVLSYSINADAPSKEMAQGFFKSAAKTLAGVAYSQENVDVLINALNEAVAAGGYKYVYNAQTGYVTFQSSDGKYGEPFIQILKNQDGTISVSDEYLARELKDKVLLKDYGKLVSKEEFQEFVENMKTVLKVSTLDFGIDAFLPKVYASSLAIFSWAAKNGIYLDIDNLNGTTYDMERFGAAEEILPENPQIAKMPAPVQNAVARQYIKTLGYKGSALFAARMLNEFLPINQDTLEIYAAYPNSRAAEILNQIDALRKGERLDYASPINKPGTAGVRGAIGDRLAGLDIASAQVIAQAQADLAKEAGMSDQTISIAGDTRYGGSEFIKAVAGVFIANGFKVEIFESAIPTPLISFYTKDKGIGVNITASHNRGSDNGYKFTIDGAQASDDYAKKLMSRMDEIAELEKSGNAAVKYESPEGKMIVSPTRDVSVNYANALLQMAAGFFNISEQELKDRIRESQNAGKAPLFVFEVNNGASPVVWGDIFTAFGIDTNNVVM